MRLLLDDNCPRKLAEILARVEPRLEVLCIQDWQNGRFLGRGDDEIPDAAADDKLVLFTFDVSTVPAVLSDMAVAGRPHAGVVFASCKRTPHSDIAVFARALARLWRAESEADWTNRVVYLTLDTPI